MRVLVVAEYYPRAGDPVLGIWAHRQALATRAAGVEVQVLVLHRPLPSLAAIRARDLVRATQTIRQPAVTVIDGLPARYLRYLSPPRPLSYDAWGGWAAPWLRRTLTRIRARFPFDLVHAHYAVPAGDAIRRAAPRAPLVLSVHGHDLYGRASISANVRDTLAHAQLVLANSTGTARLCEQHGARATRVIHLGADLPPAVGPRPQTPTLVTLGHLAARKRHADVISALAVIGERRPELHYVIVGDGPERQRLRAQAAALGLERRVQLLGQLPHEQAIAAAQGGSLFVMPSVDEAFGVAYIEAMAGGVPAIGCRGESGPEEIAAAGAGITLVPPRDPRVLAQRITSLLADPGALEALGRDARATVQRAFTWEQCGRETVAAYEAALSAS